MFSALKKLVGSDQAAVRDKNIPAGLQSMNQALQRRFAKGVQYNSESRPGRRLRSRYRRAAVRLRAGAGCGRCAGVAVRPRPCGTGQGSL